MAAAFSGGPTYADNGDFETPGRWLDGPQAVSVGAITRQAEDITAPAVSGSIRKDFGARRQRIELKVCYVAASEADILTAWQADMDDLSSARLTLTVDGQAYQGCELDAGSYLTGRTDNGYGTAIIAFGRVIVWRTRFA